MRVAAIQMAAEPTTVADRLDRIAGHVEVAARQGAELAVFPEGSLTGYTLSRATFHEAEAVTGPSVGCLVELSRASNIVIIAGIVERDSTDFYSTLVVVAPQGLLGRYRKMHVSPGETAFWASGRESEVIPTPVGRIGLGICADMMFRSPWARYAERVDTVAIAAAWPDFRQVRPVLLGATFARAHFECSRRQPEIIQRVLGVPVIYSAACGQAGKVLGMRKRLRFAGGSRIIDTSGAVATADEGESVVVANVAHRQGAKGAGLDQSWTRASTRLFRLHLFGVASAGAWLTRPLYWGRPR